MQKDWDTLCTELERREATGEPVETLIQRVRNTVVKVGDDHVIVRSERTGRDRRIEKRDIENDADWNGCIIDALRRLGGY